MQSLSPSLPLNTDSPCPHLHNPHFDKMGREGLVVAVIRLLPGCPKWAMERKSTEVALSGLSWGSSLTCEV